MTVFSSSDIKFKEPRIFGPQLADKSFLSSHQSWIQTSRQYVSSIERTCNKLCCLTTLSSLSLTCNLISAIMTDFNSHLNAYVAPFYILLGNKCFKMRLNETLFPLKTPLWDPTRSQRPPWVCCKHIPNSNTPLLMRTFSNIVHPVDPLAWWIIRDHVCNFQAWNKQQTGISLFRFFYTIWQQWT